jgi:hypothetical protein
MFPNANVMSALEADVFALILSRGYKNLSSKVFAPAQAHQRVLTTDRSSKVQVVIYAIQESRRVSSNPRSWQCHHTAEKLEEIPSYWFWDRKQPLAPVVQWWEKKKGIPLSHPVFMLWKSTVSILEILVCLCLWRLKLWNVTHCHP